MAWVELVASLVVVELVAWGLVALNTFVACIHLLSMASVEPLVEASVEAS